MKDDKLGRKEKVYRILFWSAFIGSILVYFWGIWAIPTLTHNEGRRMIVVQEMLSRQNWLIPTINHEIYIEKPPLFYWLALAFALLFHSTAEWVLRLPSALGAFGFTWFLFHRVRKHLGQWVALFSALILITCLHFSHSARIAEIPMILTVCCGSAVLFYFDYLNNHDRKSRLYLAYLFLGLGFMAKGPVVLIFFLPPILVFGIFQKDRHALKGLLFVRGWLLFALLAFPWYLYTLLSLGREHLGGVIEKDIVHKVAGTSNSEPIYRYPLVLLATFMPWVLIFAYRPKIQIKRLFSETHYAYFGYVFLVPLLIMSFFSAREANYIVPILPSAAVLLGICVANFFKNPDNAGKDRLNSRLALGVVILMMFHFSYYVAVEPRIKKDRYEAFQPVISKIRESAEHPPVYGYRNLFYQLIYYYGQPIPKIGDQEVEKMISEGEPFILLAENKYWDHLKGLSLRILIEYKPYRNKRRAIRVLKSEGQVSGKPLNREPLNLKTHS